MNVIRWADKGVPCVVCLRGGVYLTSFKPITDHEVNAINTALEVEGLEASEPHLKRLPNYGDLIPLQDWMMSVASGSFIDYDGHGYWATEKGMWCGHMGEFRIKPSDITQHSYTVPAWATHVMWFNR